MVDIDAYRSWAQEVRKNHNDYVMITPDAVDEILDEHQALRDFERKAAEITVQPISDSHKVERIHELIAQRKN